MAAIATVVASWAALRALAIQTSPDIIMFIRSDDVSPSQARLVIRNIGEAPAYDVAYRLSPDLFVKDSFEYAHAFVVFDRGYAILPPKQERNILLGRFEDLEGLWGHSIVDVKVSFSKRYGRRRFSTICPVEIGSFESTITIGSVRPGLTFRPVIFLRLHNGRPLSNLNPARGDAPETGRVARLALPFHADLPANSPSPRRAPAS